MTALVLTLVIDCLLAGVVWLVLGSRFKWAAEAKTNDVRNLLAYGAIGLPFVFIGVFYLVEHL